MAMRVKATREGNIGQRTATNYRIETVVPFVALPSYAAIRLWVKVTNPANGKSIRALVLDVGPWETEDHAYVFDGARPFAECGFDRHGRRTNRAGIDLGERVWRELEMTDNTEVEWEFL